SAVADALHETNPRFGRHALQFVQRKTQRTIHHAVNQEAILQGIGVRRDGVVSHEVERAGCDDSLYILKRGHHLPGESIPHRLVMLWSRSLETRTGAVEGVAGLEARARLFGCVFGYVSSLHRGVVGRSLTQSQTAPGPHRSDGQTGQLAAILQKSPTI